MVQLLCWAIIADVATAHGRSWPNSDEPPAGRRGPLSGVNPPRRPTWLESLSVDPGWENGAFQKAPENCFLVLAMNVARAVSSLSYDFETKILLSESAPTFSHDQDPERNFFKSLGGTFGRSTSALERGDRLCDGQCGISVRVTLS